MRVKVKATIAHNWRKPSQIATAPTATPTSRRRSDGLLPFAVAAVFAFEFETQSSFAFELETHHAHPNSSASSAGASARACASANPKSSARAGANPTSSASAGANPSASASARAHPSASASASAHPSASAGAVANPVLRLADWQEIPPQTNLRLNELRNPQYSSGRGTSRPGAVSELLALRKKTENQKQEQNQTAVAGLLGLAAVV